MATKRKAAISELIKSDMEGRFTAPANEASLPEGEEAPKIEKTQKIEKAPEPVKKNTAQGKEPLEKPQTAAVPKIAGGGAAFFKYVAEEVEASPLFDRSRKTDFYDFMLSQAKRSVYNLQNGFHGGIVIMLGKNQT
jgi:hypothetical protein